MLVINATVLSSGDQLVAPTFRVVYSFSIENGCTSRFKILLVICFGSVIACAEAGADCANRDVEARRIVASENCLDMAVEFTTEIRNSRMKPQRTRRNTKVRIWLLDLLRDTSCPFWLI